MPGLVIDTPVTERTLCQSLSEALKRDTPTAIRYCNDCEQDAVFSQFYSAAEECTDISCRADFDECDKEALDAIVITDGRIVTEAMTAAVAWNRGTGKRTGIILLERIKPYHTAAEYIAARLPQKTIPLIFLEEEIRAGGMGVTLADVLSREHASILKNKQMIVLAPEDDFVIRERNESIYMTAGVSAERILAVLRQF